VARERGQDAAQTRPCPECTSSISDRCQELPELHGFLPPELSRRSPAAAPADTLAA